MTVLEQMKEALEEKEQEWQGRVGTITSYICLTENEASRRRTPWLDIT